MRGVDHADGFAKDQHLAQRAQALEQVEVIGMQQVERSNGAAIDVVIAWVDGSDPKHRAKRKRYRADPGGSAKPERSATDERRFSDNDEIRFCLRSIRNYAPWVRTIWLVTDDQVPAAIDREKAELYNVRIVDHREIFRGYEQLLPTFNSRAIETMLWRIEGLADRFVYFNDDMMLVGPVEPTDFFSHDGKVMLRGRWSNWNAQLEKGNSFNGGGKLLGAEMLGYTPKLFFSSDHMNYPMLRPAMEELFEEFRPAFLANAAYRFRNREQFWPISAHDHLLLNSGRARVVKPRNSAHFSVRYCLTASPDALEARLKQLADGTTRFACINYLEAVIAKVPDAMSYLSTATGPAAPFEKPRTEAYASRPRKRPFASLGSTLVASVRDMFAKRGNGRDEKPASGVSSAAGAHSAGGANLAANSSSEAGYPALRVVRQRGVPTSGRDELTPTEWRRLVDSDQQRDRGDQRGR